MSYFPSPCDHSNWVKTQPQRRRFYAWLECQQISVDLLSEEWIMHRMPPLRIDSRAGKRRNKGRQDQIARRRPEVSILYESNAPSENNTELWSQDLLSDFWICCRRGTAPVADVTLPCHWSWRGLKFNVRKADARGKFGEEERRSTNTGIKQ